MVYACPEEKVRKMEHFIKDHKQCGVGSLTQPILQVSSAMSEDRSGKVSYLQ